MMITKCAKRLMATVMTTAIVLTGFAVAPKEVKAAEENPTVEVKGATLKIEGSDDDKQSMRIGVEIGKADFAAACGMTIEYKGHEVTVATDQGQDKIYDYDEENNKVVYTAVVKNIPADAFAEDFQITGLVKKAGQTDYTKTETVTKSVNGIVNELGTDYKLVEGNLVKKIITLKNNTPEKGPFKWNDIMYVADDKGNTATGSKTEMFGKQCVKVEPDKNNSSLSGLEFAFVGSDDSKIYANKRVFYVQAEAYAESGCALKFNFNDDNGRYAKTLESKEGDFSSIAMWTKEEYFNPWGWDRVRLVANKISEPIYVKSFDVYEKVKEVSDLKIARDIDVDLEKVASLNGLTYNSEEKGIKFLATFPYNGTKKDIYIKEDKSLIINLKEYEKVRIEYSCDRDNVPSYAGAMTDSGNPCSQQYFQAGNSTNVVELSLEKPNGDNIQFVRFGYNTYGKDKANCPDVNYVIKSIKLIAKK